MRKLIAAAVVPVMAILVWGTTAQAAPGNGKGAGNPAAPGLATAPGLHGGNGMGNGMGNGNGNGMGNGNGLHLPGPNGHNNFGLCHAFSSGSANGQSHKANAGPFGGLSSAAGGNVAGFCSGATPGGRTR